MQTLKTTVQATGSLDKIIQPYHDRIIIRRDTPAQFTASGFEIPGAFLQKPNTGIILSVGKRASAELQVGMYVLFGRNSGTEITLNEQTYVIMRDEDCVLEIPLSEDGHPKVFGDRLLIEASEPPKSIRGIFIPDTIEEQPQTGICRYAGPKCDEVKPEANVLFGKYAGIKVLVKGKEYVCCRQVDIFANLDENA